MDDGTEEERGRERARFQNSKAERREKDPSWAVVVLLVLLSAETETASAEAHSLCYTAVVSTSFLLMQCARALVCGFTGRQCGSSLLKLVAGTF